MTRRPFAVYACVGLLTAATGLLLLRAAGSAPSPERAIGFTPAAFVRQRAVERRYLASVSIPSIDAAHRALTRRPHRAGTAGALEVARYIKDTLEEAGLGVEVTEYLAYLSEPRSVAVDIVAPVQESLDVAEPADPRDPDTAHPEIDPGFIAYSSSGSVTAPVVYANYGLPADYAALKAAGVDVRGRIVLARYGRSHRAVKVFGAEQAGALGVILYSDPADDGAGRGSTWPDGMWRTTGMLQRGNAKYSWLWHGDPLTPGTPATQNAPFLAPEAAPTLPKIPVAVLSARAAERIWRLGPGAANVRLQVDMKAERKPIRNVIGRIRGAMEPDRWVMLGTHHDAWTFGGIDPGSSAAVVIEVARGLARLQRAGWRPARSLVFAFWDAEEYGLVGSTEFAEDRARELQERAVVYINSDMYTRGRLVAGGVPSLRDFVAEVAAAAVPGAPAVNELSPLGSGADFVAFQDHLGIPTLALEFLFEGGYGFGAYHSSYDSRYYMENVADPGFAQGAALARLLGIAVMRLAAAPVLPYRYSHYAERIGAFLQESEHWKPAEGPVSIAEATTLRALASDVASRARAIERSIDDDLISGRVPANGRRLNDALARLEQVLLDTSQPPDRRWYRHLIYGWNIHSMYDGQPLPGLALAVRSSDAAALALEQQAIGRALERMRQSLVEIAALLPR